MKPSQTIFCKDDNTVTISQSEYNKLLQYKQLCKEFKAVLTGDAEWVGTIPVCLTLNTMT